MEVLPARKAKAGILLSLCQPDREGRLTRTKAADAQDFLLALSISHLLSIKTYQTSRVEDEATSSCPSGVAGAGWFKFLNSEQCFHRVSARANNGKEVGRSSRLRRHICNSNPPCKGKHHLCCFCLSVAEHAWGSFLHKAKVCVCVCCVAWHGYFLLSSFCMSLNI